MRSPGHESQTVDNSGKAGDVEDLVCEENEDYVAEVALAEGYLVDEDSGLSSSRVLEAADFQALSFWRQPTLKHSVFRDGRLLSAQDQGDEQRSSTK